MAQHGKVCACGAVWGGFVSFCSVPQQFIQAWILLARIPDSGWTAFYSSEVGGGVLETSQL
eukprot:4952159-Amphidinium_carterae.1